MSSSLQQLYQTYQAIVGPESVCYDPHGGQYLHFPITLDLNTAKLYTHDLASTDLPKILSFGLRSPLDCGDLDSQCTNFIYWGDWPADLSAWLNHVIHYGETYPRVTYIRINNVQTVLSLSQKDLFRLKQVFPNLTQLQSIHQEMPGDDKPQTFLDRF
jgi:hypothetical protein